MEKTTVHRNRKPWVLPVETALPCHNGPVQCALEYMGCIRLISSGAFLPWPILAIFMVVYWLNILWFYSVRRIGQFIWLQWLFYFIENHISYYTQGILLVWIQQHAKLHSLKKFCFHKLSSNAITILMMLWVLLHILIGLNTDSIALWIFKHLNPVN